MSLKLPKIAQEKFHFLAKPLNFFSNFAAIKGENQFLVFRVTFLKFYFYGYGNNKHFT